MAALRDERLTTPFTKGAQCPLNLSGADMAASDLEIINQALVMLGANPIASLDEGTKQATAAAVFYPLSRDEVLRAHPWNFAIKRVHLSPLTTPPAYGYSAAFQLPSDWLRTLEVSADEFNHEGGQILCNASGIDLRYVFRNTAVTTYDSLCVAAISCNLSAKLAVPITGSTSLQQTMWQMYTAQLAQARAIDAQEEPAPMFEPSRLLAERY